MSPTLFAHADFLEATAACFAIGAHGAQSRKYTGEPYWRHCQEVAERVRAAGGDPAMMAAAWLHDVVEDTGAALDIVKMLFGEDVATLVSALTDEPPGSYNRKERKQRDCDRLARASARAQTIKLADLIANARNIAACDPDFAVVFMREAAALLSAMTQGDPALYAEAQTIVRDYRT